MPHFAEMSYSGGASVVITPTGSPFTYGVTRPGMVLVNGGTVTIVEFGRGGVFAVAGVIAGAVPVWKNDSVRVTYVVAPTMTFFPA